MGAERTLLVTVTGHDRPGVTSALFGGLAGRDIEVVDVEQVVIRGRLVLGVLVTVGEDEGALRGAVSALAER
ncbi:MAG TPA: ACT domain-containing protein, partial [Acidimicrobiia bacterium]|nr:ACT domain-containing protein [Acidimicrobiia bacterium]